MERAPVRRFDTVTDPQGASNRVLDVDQARLLLQDPDGVRFILAKRRLGRGWRHRPALSRVADVRTLPRVERGRRRRAA